MKKMVTVLIFLTLINFPLTSAINNFKSSTSSVALIALNSSIKHIKVSYKSNQKINHFSKELLKLISKGEGKISTPYTGVSGYSLVGIGHIILPKDSNLIYPLSEYQIDSIFYEDINIRLNSAIKNFPMVKDSSILYGIAWIYFSGIGNKLNNPKTPILKQMKYNLENHIPIDSLLMQFIYCYDKKNKIYKLYENLIEIRSKHCDFMYPNRKKKELNLNNYFEDYELKPYPECQDKVLLFLNNSKT